MDIGFRRCSRWLWQGSVGDVLLCAITGENLFVINMPLLLTTTWLGATILPYSLEYGLERRVAH